MTTPHEQKQQLRAAMRRELRSLTADPAWRERESQQLTRRVLGSPLWAAARCVLLFASLPDEPDTAALIAEAYRSGRQVVLPRVAGDDLELCLYTPGMLTRGAYGILEPSPEAALLSAPGDIDLALIPGLAFTRQGSRLGRGKGYYDRLLPCLRCPVYGLAFAPQVVAELPLEPWDQPIDGVM
jgi:5-formyltetrahydrofolate cyclo-ligase